MSLNADGKRYLNLQELTTWFENKYNEKSTIVTKEAGKNETTNAAVTTNTTTTTNVTNVTHVNNVTHVTNVTNVINEKNVEEHKLLIDEIAKLKAELENLTGSARKELELRLATALTDAEALRVQITAAETAAATVVVDTVTAPNTIDSTSKPDVESTTTNTTTNTTNVNNINNANNVNTV